MTRLSDVETFVQIVEAGSISNASEQLRLGKSVVSRRLSRLEERLGVRLLNRTTRRMHLSDAGAEFFQRCQAIIAEIEDAEAAATESQAELRGALKIAAPLSFGTMRLQGLLSDFMCEHPKLRCEVVLNDRRVDIVEEGIDIAIRIGALEDSSLVAVKLAEIRPELYATPEFWALHGEPQAPEDLASLPFVQYSNVPDRFYLWDKQGKEHRIKTSPVLRVNNGEFGHAAALKSIGYVCGPRFIAFDDINNGRVIRVLKDFHLKPLDLNLLYPSRQFLPAKVRAFISFMKDRMPQQPDWC